MLNPGFMTDTQIRHAMNEKEVIIFPFEESNLTPVGYNFSFSKFIVSLNKKNFVPIMKDKTTGESYFILKSNETVLVLTRETISVSKSIGGTFHSKVSQVTRGLGHVSTTLDPGWQGQLLVPLYNPTKKNIHVVIEEKKNNRMSYKTFLTLVMFKSSDNATKSALDHKPARIELLEEILNKKRPGKRREKLVNVVKTLTSFYDVSNKIIDLSTNISRRENYDEYIKQQKDLLKLLENNYPNVQEAAQKLRLTGKFIFYGIIISYIILLAVFSLLGYYNMNTVIGDSIKLLLPVLIPFSIFFLNNIKDKFL